jgi:histone-lysine N-methyltransferase SETD2
VAFVSSEREEDYIWCLTQFQGVLHDNIPEVLVTDKDMALMNAISLIFPLSANFLCVWHINKNVLSYLKPFFEDETTFNEVIMQWNALIRSTTSEVYSRELEILRELLKVLHMKIKYRTSQEP